MSRSRERSDLWEEIFDDLILESEPPIRYIKDAIIVTKTGAKFKVSADDLAGIIAREKTLGPDQRDIYSCSLNIDFTRIKRDVNRWTNKFIEEIEQDALRNIEEQVSKKRRRTRKTAPPKVD